MHVCGIGFGSSSDRLPNYGEAEWVVLILCALIRACFVRLENFDSEANSRLWLKMKLVDGWVHNFGLIR